MPPEATAEENYFLDNYMDGCYYLNSKVRLSPSSEVQFSFQSNVDLKRQQAQIKETWKVFGEIARFHLDETKSQKQNLLLTVLKIICSFTGNQ